MSEREVQELVEQLQQAREAYYNDDPIMSDAEYDALEDELRELDPKNAFFKQVGAKAEKKTKWKKVKHGAPMGSLMKVQTQEEFDKWAADARDKIAKAERAGDLEDPTQEVVVSEKLDGISISLKYDKGKLVQAVTRGDGETGEDITRNVLLMKGVVKDARDLTGYVRGEIVLKRSDHKKHVPEYKNPRNAASGIAKRESDADPCKHLTILCYQVLSHQHPITTKSIEFKLLKALGFSTPNWKRMAFSAVADHYQEYVQTKRDQLDYEIDGLVVEHDDLNVMEHLGEHDGRPKGARAYKFPHQERPTRLRDVQWEVGPSGRITPVAYFDAVEIDGAMLSRASLHNVKNFRRLRLWLGCRILVSRRNQVIPYVEKNLDARQQ